MMSKVKPTAAAGAKELTAEEFMARHQSELAEDESLKLGPPPRMVSQVGLANADPEITAWFRAVTNTHEYQLISELRKWWLVRLLVAANKENSPEAYRELLESFLIKLGVEAPEGVFIPRRGPRGAPRKQSTEQTYVTW